MAAYIIFTREKTLDRLELEVYWKKIRDTFEGHSIKVLAAYGKQEILEGTPVEGVVIAEFPSIETAKSWYYSPAYQEAAQHRMKGAVYNGVIVEGVSTSN